ncbi:hypothetical protein MSAN_01730900 [Mycena sanguinolenta]|uniref:Uncharacterized protein n=1 Tax=Mycena sanguinolenta TaxID=230812 RepID=A0A8H6XWB0_9AGAR|nr:hypothetical protein MSAN_01730900 [Mycena sanguinolenta]
MAHGPPPVTRAQADDTSKLKRAAIAESEPSSAKKIKLSRAGLDLDITTSLEPEVEPDVISGVPRMFPTAPGSRSGVDFGMSIESVAMWRLKLMWPTDFNVLALEEALKVADKITDTTDTDKTADWGFRTFAVQMIDVLLALFKKAADLTKIPFSVLCELFLDDDRKHARAKSPFSKQFKAITQAVYEPMVERVIHKGFQVKEGVENGCRDQIQWNTAWHKMFKGVQELAKSGKFPVASTIRGDAFWGVLKDDALKTCDDPKFREMFMRRRYLDPERLVLFDRLDYHAQTLGHNEPQTWDDAHAEWDEVDLLKNKTPTILLQMGITFDLPKKASATSINTNWILLVAHYPRPSSVHDLRVPDQGRKCPDIGISPESREMHKQLYSIKAKLVKELGFDDRGKVSNKALAAAHTETGRKALFWRQWYKGFCLETRPEWGVIADSPDHFVSMIHAVEESATVAVRRGNTAKAKYTRRRQLQIVTFIAERGLSGMMEARTKLTPARTRDSLRDELRNRWDQYVWRVALHRVQNGLPRVSRNAVSASLDAPLPGADIGQNGGLGTPWTITRDREKPEKISFEAAVLKFLKKQGINEDSAATRDCSSVAKFVADFGKKEAEEAAKAAEEDDEDEEEEQGDGEEEEEEEEKEEKE